MRKRILSPGFFDNYDLGRMIPLARLLFAGLWCYADCEGRFKWEPERIKVKLLPYDIGCDVQALLGLLEEASLILRYNVNGKQYGCVTNFLEHQRPHPRESPSKIPAYEEGEPKADPGQTQGESKADSIYIVSNSVSIKEPELLENQKLPDVEDIMFSSGTKLKDDLENISTDLVKEKIFPKAFAFKNKALNENKNKRAILHTLKQCMLNKPKEPYAYCVHVLKIEDGNYNERESTGSSPTSRE